MERKPAGTEYTAENFRCVRCGRCCTGDGYVNVSPEECEKISDFLGIPLDELLERYTHKMPGYQHWLKDGEGKDIPCIFLDRDKNGLASCRIDPVKPHQCRTFPYEWRANGMEHWCEGVRRPASSSDSASKKKAR
ncbi:YkgJ family cysteine cluster protein [bacterium]|nr:YkgJ family cysteine cluster protein [bacterium]